MTLDELNTVTQRQNFVYLTIPRKKLPKGTRIRLLSRSGPYGRICTVNQTDRGVDVVAVFECKALSEFLEANT